MQLRLICCALGLLFFGACAELNKLASLAQHPEWAAEDLRTFAAESLALGAVEYFEPYEVVHRDNVAACLKVMRS